jgi:hypothetical protein
MIVIHILLWWFVASFAMGIAWIGACLSGRWLLRVYPTLAPHIHHEA